MIPRIFLELELEKTVVRYEAEFYKITNMGENDYLAHNVDSIHGKQDQGTESF